MIKKNKLLIQISLIYLIIGFFNKIFSNDYYGYPFFFIIENCEVALMEKKINRQSSDEILKGREKYKICMNFVMSLSTTLNGRCMKEETKKNIKPEEMFTYADLSNVKSTQELINEIIEYYKQYPHFSNQIAWLHASKAISQRWPCKRFIQ